jgi:hypothetical protein
MNTYHVVWWSFALPIGAVGVTAAVASSSMVTTVIMFGLIASSLGVLSASLQTLDGEGQASRPISASTVLSHGCAAGAAVVALYGMAALLGVAVLPLALVLAVTHPTLANRLRTGRRERLPEETVGHDPSAPVDDERDNARPNLDALTDPELCLAWRRSFVALQHTDDVEELTEIAGLRQQILDELERRNPNGFVDWLASGARAPSNPARYLLDRNSRRHQEQ